MANPSALEQVLARLRCADEPFVVEGCARCGWRSDEMPASEAREAFASHDCDAAPVGNVLARRSGR